MSLHRIAGAAGRTLLNTLYLLLSFPLGLAYFVFLAVGFALGFGLIITVLGAPILILVLLGSWQLTRLERMLTVRMLGAQIDPVSRSTTDTWTRSERGASSAGHWLAQGWTYITSYLKHPVTWKGLVYLLVKLPFGLLVLFILLSLGSLSAVFLTAPFFYESIANDLYRENAQVGWVTLGGEMIDTLGEALIASVVGVVFLIMLIICINVLAYLWRQIAQLLLGSRSTITPPAAPETERYGPVSTLSV